MISAVSNISFRGDMPAVDLSSPSKFTAAPVADMPADRVDFSRDEEQTSKTGRNIAIGTVIAALAAFAGLGYAVKTGKITEMEVPAEGFVAKSKAYINNAAHKVGSWGESCYNTVAGWFNKGEKTT